MLEAERRATFAEIEADLDACWDELVQDTDAAHGHAVAAFERAQTLCKFARLWLAELVADLEAGLVGHAADRIADWRAA